MTITHNMISVDSILSDEHDLTQLNDLCRLCGNLKDASALIFDDVHQQHYDDVINIYFRDEFKICRDDILPQRICRNCLTSVESWNQFYINCVHVNEKYLQIIEKFSLTKEVKKKSNDMNNDNINTDIEVIEVGVEGDNYDFFNDQVVTNELDITNIKFSDTFPVTGNFQTFDNTIEDISYSNDAVESKTSNQLSTDHPEYTACNSTLSNNESEEENTEIIEPHFCPDSGSKRFQQDNSSLPKETSPTAKTRLRDPQIPPEFEGFLRRHSNNIKYMQCDKCDFICRPMMTLFTKHYQTHADCLENAVYSEYIEEFLGEADKPQSVGKIFQCSKCTKSFSQRRSFCRHLKVHQSRVYRCNECDCQFKTKLAFRSHKEKHRKPKEVFHCNQCNKDFKSKDGYRYHCENRCILIKCNQCEETFHQAGDLKEHMKQSHNITMSNAEQEHLVEAQTSMCFVCGKIVKDSNLERHMVVHTEEKPFVCDLCGKSFKFKSAIRDHMMIKLGMKDYVCEICGRKFVKKCYLNKHIRFHAKSKKGLQNLQCDICSEQFMDKKKLILHKRSSHDAEKPFSCDLCNKSYTSKVLLRQHLLREVICVLCEEMFTSNDLLKQHVNLVHTLTQYREAVNDEDDSNPAVVYPCEICGRRFTTEERYKQHQLTELSCELCDEKFTLNEDLKSHIKSKHNLNEYRKVILIRWQKQIKLGGIHAAEYPCNICGKKLFYRRTLFLHMRMHSGLKPYKCEYCNKSYTSKHSLNTHLISEKNLREFACSYCGKRYNFNSDLIVHVKQCHESKQFSCHVCGKKFGLFKYLRDHSTIHTQAKPFNCDKCKMEFRLKKFLLRHNKKYHSTEDEQLFYIEVGTDE